VTLRFSGRLLAVGLLLAAPTFASAAVKYLTDDGQLIDALPQVLVKYKSGRAAAVQSGVLKRIGAFAVRKLKQIDVNVVNVPPGQTLQSVVNQLRQDPDVEYAEPNGVLRAFTAPNDPQYSSQYALGSNYIKAEAAWDITQGSASVVVAVIDTGITPGHADLSGNLWSNPNVSGASGAYGTRIGIDWNNDGDCTDTDPLEGPEQCAGPDPIDDDGTNNIGEYHGTRVSGIIAATADNGVGIAGIARNCKIMAVKALNSEGAGSFDGIAEAILYAVDNGASVINMSLGGPTPSQAVVNAIAYATAHNVVVVAAAGNSGNSSSVNFPASIDKVIAVGATDSSNQLAYFSCTGPALDVVAPGVGILSTVPPQAYSSSGGDGTSFSAPMVSAVVALLRTLDPNMSIEDVTRYIDFSATDLGGTGFDNGFGFGLLNAGAALTYASTGNIPLPVASPNQTYPIPNPYRPLSGVSAQIILPTNLQNANSKEIKIYNIAGERVRTLSNSTTWDGKNDDGSLVATGLYLYYVNTSLGNTKGKVTVMK
jgi:subtilisin family serine protease